MGLLTKIHQCYTIHHKTFLRSFLISRSFNEESGWLHGDGDDWAGADGVVFGSYHQAAGDGGRDHPGLWAIGVLSSQAAARRAYHDAARALLLWSCNPRSARLRPLPLPWLKFHNNLIDGGVP